jgi:hypothetical protein
LRHHQGTGARLRSRADRLGRRRRLGCGCAHGMILARCAGGWLVRGHGAALILARAGLLEQVRSRTPRVRARKGPSRGPHRDAGGSVVPGSDRRYSGERCLARRVHLSGRQVRMGRERWRGRWRGERAEPGTVRRVTVERSQAPPACGSRRVPSPRGRESAVWNWHRSLVCDRCQFHSASLRSRGDETRVRGEVVRMRRWAGAREAAPSSRQAVPRLRRGSARRESSRSTGPVRAGRLKMGRDGRASWRLGWATHRLRGALR